MKKWIKKIKRRMVPEKNILGTKEMRIYIGAGKLYKMSLRVLNCNGLYIDCEKGGDIPVAVREGETRVVLYNPYIRHLVKVAENNGLPVLYSEEDRNIPKGYFVLSNHPFRYYKGKEHIFYRHPLRAWKKMQRPELVGESRNWYDALGAMKFCSGHCFHSMLYVWGYLVLGPVCFMVEKSMKEWEKKGYQAVVVGEEEHFVAELLRKRKGKVLSLPWGQHVAEESFIRDYLSIVEDNSSRLVLFWLRGWFEEKDNIQSYVSCPVVSLEEITGQPEKNWERTSEMLERTPLVLKKIGKEGFEYEYTGERPEEDMLILSQAVMDFLEESQKYAGDSGRVLSFSPEDFLCIFEFGDRYLWQMETERREKE